MFDPDQFFIAMGCPQDCVVFRFLDVHVREIFRHKKCKVKIQLRHLLIAPAACRLLNRIGERCQFFAGMRMMHMVAGGRIGCARTARFHRGMDEIIFVFQVAYAECDQPAHLGNHPGHFFRIGTVRISYLNQRVAHEGADGLVNVAVNIESAGRTAIALHLLGIELAHVFSCLWVANTAHEIINCVINCTVEKQSTKMWEPAFLKLHLINLKKILNRKIGDFCACRGSVMNDYFHDMQTFDTHLYRGIRDCRASAVGPEQNDFAERAIATGFFNAETNIGTMVTPMLILLVLTVCGWQVAFYAMGATGLVWLMFWLKAYYDPDSHPGVSKAELDYIHQGAEPAAPKVPISKVLRLRATWAYAAGAALSMPVFWFYLYWLPPYLNKQYHLGISVVQMGLPLIVIYLTADLGSGSAACCRQP
jgi:hypothetical protein